MAEVVVRPVAAGEVEEFLDWFERYRAEHEPFGDYPDPFSRAEYRRALLEPAGRHFWWADLNGEHVGFGVFIIGPHWYRHDVTDAYIDDFYVASAARRGGVGTAVARAMLEECRRRGAHQVELQVLPRNPRAQAFWRSLGFGLESLRLAIRVDGASASPADSLEATHHAEA